MYSLLKKNKKNYKDSKIIKLLSQLFLGNESIDYCKLFTLKIKWIKNKTGLAFRLINIEIYIEILKGLVT